MKTSKTFEDLFLNFAPLSKNEMTRVIGGDDFLDNLFNKAFDFTNSTLTAAEIAVFKTQITDLNSTQVGHQMLNMMYNQIGTKIILSGENPPSTPNSSSNSVVSQFEAATNKLYLGNLDTDTSNPFYNGALNFNSISHEVFHGFVHNAVYTGPETNASAAYNRDQRSEIDATFFAYMASAEYDIYHNLSFNDANSHVRGGFGTLVVTSPSTPGEIAVKNAWDDIFLNGNFTKENYNIIEQNFTTATTYKQDNRKTSNSINSINDVLSYFPFMNKQGFIKETQIFKLMMENNDRRPNDIINSNPNIRNVASPYDNVPDSGTGNSGNGGGGSGGGGGGDYSGNNGGTNWNWPNNGSNNGNNNYNGEDGIDDKTGMPYKYDDLWPGWSSIH